MTKAAAKTSNGPASIVAMEQLFPADRRLLTDELMPQLLTGAAAVWQRLSHWDGLRNWTFNFCEKKAPGTYALFPCRKRFIQSKVALEVGNSVSALVSLGAGMDTLAYREPALEGVPVWEVDQPVNVEAKRAALVRVLGAVPENVTQVAIDFDSQALSEALAAAHFDQTQPTFYVLEAVTQYLDQTGIEATFDFLAGAADGSRLCFTYVRQEFVDGTNRYGLDMLYQRTVSNGLWKFGLRYEDVTDFLEPYGWEILEHVSSEELAARYAEPTGRAVMGTPIEPNVYAIKR